MDEEEKKERPGDFSLPQPSFSELRGRQSVRATFKLSEKAIDAISIVSVHLGIKQKSLFDHLIEDTETLDLIAQEIQSEKRHTVNRIQKTFVLSRKTLSALEKTSKTFHASRDALVEQSIQRLLPLIAREREKHQRRKETLRVLAEYVRHGEKLRQESKELLGEDDPVYDKIASAMNFLSDTYGHIESFVERGKIIEDF